MGSHTDNLTTTTLGETGNALVSSFPPNGNGPYEMSRNVRRVPDLEARRASCFAAVRHRSGGIRSLTSATSLATRLPAVVVDVSLVSLVAAIIVVVDTGRNLGQDLDDDRIDALQGSAVFGVTA
jgi:hypothetical protein